VTVICGPGDGGTAALPAGVVGWLAGVLARPAGLACGELAGT
jgi:hypothetical protein